MAKKTICRGCTRLFTEYERDLSEGYCPICDDAPSEADYSYPGYDEHPSY